MIAELLEQLDDLEEVQDAEALIPRTRRRVLLLAEELVDQELVRVHTLGSLDHPVAGLVGLAHVEQRGSQQKLAGVTVPVAPARKKADILLE